MKIKTELMKLKQMDIYSLMLFALYKLRDVPEYSAISELAYIVDKDSLLKLCEYFGGTTITIPTIDELKSMIYAMVIYEEVDINHMTYDAAIQMIGISSLELKKAKICYTKLKEVLDEYEFTQRER